MEHCAVRSRLENLVQTLLLQLAELGREEAGVIVTGDDVVIDALDKRIETTLGEKERALGALRHHREEHGC